MNAEIRQKTEQPHGKARQSHTQNNDKKKMQDKRQTSTGKTRPRQYDKRQRVRQKTREPDLMTRRKTPGYKHQKRRRAGDTRDTRYTPMHGTHQKQKRERKRGKKKKTSPLLSPRLFSFQFPLLKFWISVLHQSKLVIKTT